MNIRPLNLLRVTNSQPIPCHVLSRLKNHYFKYMRLAEQPAVFSALTLDPQQIQVKGFSQDAIQAICQYLSLPIWFRVPKGDLVRCSWFEIVCDFVSRFGTVPTLVSEQQSLGWHGRRFARCITSILKHNNVKLHPVKSLHLSCFGFGLVSSIHVQLKCAKPQGVLAILITLGLPPFWRECVWSTKSFNQSLSQLQTAHSWRLKCVFSCTVSYLVDALYGRRS